MINNADIYGHGRNDWPESPVDQEVAYLPSTKDTSTDELRDILFSYDQTDATSFEKTFTALQQYTAQESLKARINQMEETRYAIMRGEYGHDEYRIVNEFELEIATLTAQLNQVEKGDK